MMQLDQIIIDNIVLLYLGLGSAHGTTTRRIQAVLFHSVIVASCYCTLHVYS
jgi:hypothetical protein